MFVGVRPWSSHHVVLELIVRPIPRGGETGINKPVERFIRLVSEREKAKGSSVGPKPCRCCEPTCVIA